jgi:hypothetical protein
MEEGEKKKIKEKWKEKNCCGEGFPWGWTPGTLEPRIGHAGQCPEEEWRQFVTISLHHPTMCS